MALRLGQALPAEVSLLQEGRARCNSNLERTAEWCKFNAKLAFQQIADLKNLRRSSAGQKSQSWAPQLDWGAPNIQSVQDKGTLGSSGARRAGGVDGR